MTEIADCTHPSYTGWANNIGGYDVRCDVCCALISRTGTQYPPTRKVWLDDCVVVEEMPVEAVVGPFARHR